jgi:hypothetical protein
MTARNYAAMTDAELNQAAALAMGWKVWGYGYETMPNSGKLSWRGFYEFKPATDLNHAAEFSAAFMDAEQAKDRWYNLTIESVVQQNSAGVQVRRYRCKLWRGQVIDRDSGIYHALCDTEARARTEATLAAFDGS